MRQNRVASRSIREHVTVVGSDSGHAAPSITSTRTEIEPTKKDSEAGGLHHDIPLDFVDSADDDQVRLNKAAEEVKCAWSTSGAA